MLEINKDYRAILKSEYARRCERNKLYSLRAFARDLGLTSARLSEVLNGRSGLSRSAAVKLARKLNYSTEDTEIFADLVEATHARSKVHREVARLRLQKFAPDDFTPMMMDAFQAVSDWYCFAILELVRVKGFRHDTKWISNALGITSSEAEGAVQRLERLGLLQLKDGKLTVTNKSNATPDGIPSDYIKKAHEAMLMLAQRSVRTQSVDQRDLSSLILAVDSKQLSEAKAAIKEFRRSFSRRFGETQTNDRVYCLGVQFFDLTATLGEEKL